MTRTDRIRRNIDRQQQRYNAAWEAADIIKHNVPRKAGMNYSEAMDEMGKAGRRLYQLRRELARAEA